MKEKLLIISFLGVFIVVGQSQPIFEDCELFGYVVGEEYDEFIMDYDDSLRTVRWYREDILSICNRGLDSILNKVLDDNRIENWTHMYFIYHFMEGELNVDISSFIFLSESDIWGLSFLYNNGVFYSINSDTSIDIKGITPYMRWSGGYAVILSFDSNLEYQESKFLVGSPNDDGFNVIMSLYDYEMFR
jgi:hypothetical protein